MEKRERKYCVTYVAVVTTEINLDIEIIVQLILFPTAPFP